MNIYSFVGVDIAKVKFDAAIKCGNKYIEATFENTISGFKVFQKWVEKSTQNAFVCLESTGCYGEPLAEFLVKSHIKVSMVNPMQIKHFSKSILSRNKNDKVDARIIASFAEKFNPVCYIAKTEDEKEMKEVTRLIDVLQTQKKQLQIQTESMQTDWIKKDITKSIQKIEKKISELENKLKCKIEADPSSVETKKILCSIKGVGEKTAHRLIALLPHISRFKNPKQLAAYLGVCPRQHQSGKYSGKSMLSKYGDARLRKTLYMPALVVKRYNHSFSAFCKRLEKNGLQPKAIVCALMRKLVHVIFGMLKSKQAFNPEMV